jgi:hypothetical protein
MEGVYSYQTLLSMWEDVQNKRRPSTDHDAEKAYALFDQKQAQGNVDPKDRPSMKRPVWIKSTDWLTLAHLLQEATPREKLKVFKLIFTLPKASKEVPAWLKELNRLAVRTWGSSPVPSTEPHYILSQKEARSLSFGAYASLISVNQDVESLNRLCGLIDLDPIGVLALMKVALRGSSSLRKEAKSSLKTHRDALGLTWLDLADHLVATEVDTCVKEGSALYVQHSRERALTYMVENDQKGAEWTYDGLLRAAPELCIEVFTQATLSAYAPLRTKAVHNWVHLMQHWPSDQEIQTLKEQIALLTDQKDTSKESTVQKDVQSGLLSEDEGHKRGLSQMDIMLLNALLDSSSYQEIRDALLPFIEPKVDVQPPFMDVQLAMSDALAQQEDELCLPILKRTIVSNEPKVMNRSIKILTTLRSEHSSSLILNRFEHDPAQTANAQLTFESLATLRDLASVEKVLPYLRKNAYQSNALNTLLKISGHDRPITESEEWETMNAQARESEEQRQYHDGTLATLLTELTHSGDLDRIHKFKLINAAKTSRSNTIDSTLVRLIKLPTSTETESTRLTALNAYLWRLKHRSSQADPIFDLVEDRTEELKRTAAEGLALNGHGQGLKLLLGLAKDRHEVFSWRKRAIKALGCAADLRAVQVLLNVYDDPESNLHAYALEALGHMKKSEIANDVLSRLITALHSDLVDTSIAGLHYFESDQGWQALRAYLRSASPNETRSILILDALKLDPSLETLALFKEILLRDHQWTQGTLEKAYTLWKKRTDDQTWDIDFAFFDTHVSSGNLWNQCLDHLENSGNAELWLKACFAAAKRSSSHQTATARFESALRELDPAPLSLLMTHLPQAIEDVPSLAEFSLSLIGSHPESLTHEQRETLLDVTHSLRSDWSKADQDRQAGESNQDELDTKAKYWQQLVWMWGQISGGQEELQAVLQISGLPLSLYQQALFSMESQSITLPANAFEWSIGQVTECLPLLARLIKSTDTLTHLGSEPNQSSLDTWAAFTQNAQKQDHSKKLIDQVRQGDVLALNALVDQGYSEAIIRLLNEENLNDMLYSDLIATSALFGLEAVEKDLVAFAQRSTNETLRKQAWAARRRSVRNRSRRLSQEQK